MERIAVMKRYPALADRCWGHRLARRNVVGYLQIVRLFRRRNVVVDWPKIGAVTEIKTAVFQGRIIERHPSRYHAFRIARSKIIIILMDRLRAAAVRWFEEDLAEVNRDTGPEDILDQADQGRILGEVSKERPVMMGIIELTKHDMFAHALVHIPVTLLAIELRQSFLGPRINIADRQVHPGW